MTLREYQIEAHKTAIYPQYKAWEYLSLGLVSEIGELCGVKKKFLRGDFGEGEYKRRIMSEVGDCAWYVAEIMTHRKIELTDLLEIMPAYTEPNTQFLTWRLFYFIDEPKLDKAFGVLNAIIPFCGLNMEEFHQALEQNIAKLHQRQAKGTLKGDGEGVR